MSVHQLLVGYGIPNALLVGLYFILLALILSLLFGGLKIWNVTIPKVSWAYSVIAAFVLAGFFIKIPNAIDHRWLNHPPTNISPGDDL